MNLFVLVCQLTTPKINCQLTRHLCWWYTHVNWQTQINRFVLVCQLTMQKNSCQLTRYLCWWYTHVNWQTQMNGVFWGFVNWCGNFSIVNWQCIYVGGILCQVTNLYGLYKCQLTINIRFRSLPQFVNWRETQSNWRLTKYSDII